MKAGGVTAAMSVLGATSPRLEELLGGGLTRTQIELVHPALVLDAGAAFIDVLDRARLGQLEPYVLVLEGSLFDEAAAGGRPGRSRCRSPTGVGA